MSSFFPTQTSPTRTYLTFVGRGGSSDQVRAVQFSLPENVPNNSESAQDYFGREVDTFSLLYAACIPVEVLTSAGFVKLPNDPHRKQRILRV